QGSAALNRSVGEALPTLLNIPGLNILWQTGRDRLREVEEVIEGVMGGRPVEDRNRVILHPFLDEMSSAWLAADLALCRAGASTIAELTAYGVPALLVPLPTAAGGHQEANAAAMAEAGAALLLPEEELSGEHLAHEVGALIGDRERLEEMGEAAGNASREGGAGIVAEGLVTIARWLTDQERAELLSRFQGVGR
ncbi:MAG: UDP-N-acetylglucosamine--N-acetylmuramyl-(pentapeptide) pyrophosphoryl-undecaprenol N-acetylglucosamine transferase, partial [Candidatus Krumholzibacteria bacterium]|nr:UDP-N-acetylglucosamine--N-acetylmuramyl-(pentapeptide) pyrophosphoryl-undecaprenol N-acetylglucosamine transferase [Candidatus Krumholzibacteria bacterium]